VLGDGLLLLLASGDGLRFPLAAGEGLLLPLEVGEGLRLPLVLGEGLRLPLLLKSALLLVSPLLVSFSLPRSLSLLALLFLVTGDLLRDFFLASLFLLTVVTTEALFAQACRSAGTGPSLSDTGSLLLPPLRVSSFTAAPSRSLTPLDSGLGLLLLPFVPPLPLVDAGPRRSRIDFFGGGLGDLFAFFGGLLVSLLVLLSSLSPLLLFLSPLSSRFLLLSSAGEPCRPLFSSL